MLDIALSIACLIILAPLLLIIALAIKSETDGPAFFRQRRVGKDGCHFRIWKFRTMTSMDDGDVIIQAFRHDPRVTRVGHILRRLNLDELPQLLNVLSGEMSLVGPRPHAVAHDLEFARVHECYALRLAVKPGITGWAQVNGFRGQIADAASLGKRVEYDLYYIAHRSVWFDSYIILLTALPKAFRNAF